MPRTRDNLFDRTAGRSAFTLLELLIVMSIIVFLASVIVVAARGGIGMGQKAAAKATIAKLAAALEAYTADEGDYPYGQGADAIRAAYFALKESGQLQASDVRGKFLEQDVRKDALTVTAYDPTQSPIELTVNASPTLSDYAWGGFYVEFTEGAAGGVTRPVLANKGNVLSLGGKAFPTANTPVVGDKVRILAKLVNDSWGRRVKYRYPRSKDDGHFDLWSMGPDGKDAGDANDPADQSDPKNLDNLVYGDLENR